MASWGIVGGGMLGASLALHLADHGEEVTLYEAADSLGGLASAWSIGSVTWDRFYHVILGSDSENLRLLERLGLESETAWVGTRTASWLDGDIHSMSSALDYLRFPGLSLIGKSRLALTMLNAAREEDWRSLEDIPLEDWLRTRSGDAVFESFWLPLLKSKLGDAYADTSAAFIWATIQRLYGARSGSNKTESFGYVRGGYARTLGALTEELLAVGVEVRLGSRVSSVEPGPRVLDGNRETGFDRVVLTTPPPVTGRLVPGLEPGEQERLINMPYQGIVCPSLVLSGPLDGYYLTYLHDPAPFTSVIEMSALVDPEELNGHSLVYLPAYCAPDAPLMTEPSDSIRDRFLNGLQDVYPIASKREVLAFEVARARYVYPVSTLGYSKTLPGFDLSVPGIHHVSSAHIVNGTLNVNETLQLSRRAFGHLSELPVGLAT